MEATQKQIEFAKKLGIEKPWEKSKEELMRLIDEKKQQKLSQLQKAQPEAPKERKGYHLTPEQVRYNAMDIALRYFGAPKDSKDMEKVILNAEMFEAWMLREG